MDDDTLLALVADSLAADGPPADAVEAAYAAFGWRTLEAELAQLTADAEPEVVAFHHAPGPGRIVRLRTGHGTIELAIGSDRVEVTVQPPPQRVLLRRPEDGPGDGTELALDPAGRAVATGLAGPLRLELTWATGTSLTPWFTV